MEPVRVGEAGYTVTDESTFVLIARTDIYDVHVKFRISNALVDVSARTRTRPDERTTGMVLGLAKKIAIQLGEG